MSKIFEKIRNVTADHLRISPDEITEESNFSNDLGADSVDIIELFMVLEEECKIEIPDKDIQELITVSKAVAYIEDKISSSKFC